MIKIYLGAGAHSCCREEGGRRHASSGLACAWLRSQTRGKELSDRATFVLNTSKGRLDSPAQTGSVPRKHHSTPRFVKFTSRRVCGPSVLLKQSKGVKAEQGQGCEFVFPRFPQNLISSPKQLECLAVFSKDEKKKIFSLLC